MGSPPFGINDATRLGIKRPLEQGNMATWRLLFALVFLFLRCAHAQTCEAYTDFTSVCFVHLPQGASVFVPPGFTLQNLTDNAAELLEATNLLPPPCGFYA